MVKKKVVQKKRTKGRIKPVNISVEKQIENFGKEIAKGTEDVEKWVLERRKFLIKLAWVVGFITVLLIVSRVYMRVKGFG